VVRIVRTSRIPKETTVTRVDEIATNEPPVLEKEADGAPTTMSPPVVALRRRTIDTVLIGVGTVCVAVLAIAGGLLTWGHNFASDYVHDELSSQNVYFPDEAALQKEGRTDLVRFAGDQVTTGPQAEAYASYIGHHLEGIAGGATYADLGKPESAAKAAVQAAKDGGQSAAAVADLQAKADAVTNQRNTLFKGETLRGLLLSSYAWSTIGRIAGVAAVVAFVAAGVMAVLVGLGIVHRVRTRQT
jgi:hypothetical protein